jgi:putative tricarboxylic transport membrane protein
MRRLSMPLAPAVIGLILGPLAEQQLRRSLAIGGSPMILFTRPISAVLLLFAVGLIVATVIRPRFKTESRS